MASDYFRSTTDQTDWEKEEQELGLYVPYCLKVLRDLLRDQNGKPPDSVGEA